tara:strand:+ start:607 stop:1038 length:432 start_codon:yes stop_codon:yes gene_type:complete
MIILNDASHVKFFTYLANSYRDGIELSGANQVSKSLNLGGNLTLSQNKIEEFTAYVDDYSTAEFQQEAFTCEDTNIAFSPNAIASAIIEYRPVKNLSLNWMSKYEGKQYLNNSASDSRSLDASLLMIFRSAIKCNRNSSKAWI